MKKLLVWKNGKFEEVKVGQKVSVLRSGSGHTVFGEEGKITRTTKNNIIIETISGATVKTDIETLNTVGKAKKEGYFVSLNKIDKFNNLIKEKVAYWNEKKLVFESI